MVLDSLQGLGWIGWQMLVVITIGLFATITITFLGWFRQRFHMDVDILEERANGALTEFQVKGRVFNDKGVRVIRFGTMFAWNLKNLPAPNPAGITLGRNGRERVKYYKALNGEYYQILITKKIPTHGTLDEEGNVVFDEWKEIVFSPVNQDYKSFARMELKRAYETHKSKNFWERHGGLIALMGVSACVALVLIILIWYTFQHLNTANANAVAVMESANLVRAVTLP